MNTTIDTDDSINGSLVDDWESYKAYTRFYYLTDEAFLYANPILILIGIPTHALSMIIFLRKRMCRYPVSVFMAMLSLANILILAGPVTMQWLNHKVFIGFVVTGSPFLCAFHVYIDLVGSSINSWLILMIAVERYLSVTKPFLIRTSFNRRQAWIIVLSVFLIALIAPLGLAIVASNVNDCLLFFSKTYQIIGSIQIFFIYVLPSIFILTLSIITVHKLRNRIRSSGSRRIHISVMLITVSFSFITFTMPYQVCWYWLFSTAIGSVKLNLKVNILNIGFRYLSLTIRNLNYTLNFFLYSLTSTVFLKEVFTIAHCNYFLNETFLGRNSIFRCLCGCFTVPDEQREQQPINKSVNQEKINDDNNSTNQNYQSFSNYLHSNKDSSKNDNNQLENEFLNGHLNLDTTTTNVSINLKPLKTKPKPKKLKWNLKPANKSLSSSHLNDDDDDQEQQQQQQQQLQAQQQQQQSSFNFTSTSNIHEINK
ncbi:unnamed protein product [Rotaria socialis]|uniref:G-protein coupled receptors family 1 profile domain-containing protein n=1 Tax=Rotaria socialis TaxID=392032 RepID=A0A817TDT8_9BILA|nr:unnamed protein product [Rotaria socialis]CAF4369124.1 unnamed protein product [Rotaria socialis]